LTTRKPSGRVSTVIYGIHPVLETLRAGKRKILEILTSKGPSMPEWAESALQARRIPVTALSPADMLSSTETQHHQGLAARVGPFPYVDLEDMLTGTQGTGLVLVLDEVQDPANFGNILRSAECLGAAGVVIARDRSVPITPVVEKSASGASAHVPVARVINLVRAIEDLKTAHYWIYGTAAEAGDTLYACDLTGQAAVVLGSEGRGVRRLVREHCDKMMSVPMLGKTASLNVSQTAVIVLAESLRQRLATSAPTGS
jgi:23S rRNA (guanosine2251-2'-O)-methyltransferase